MKKEVMEEGETVYCAVQGMLEMLPAAEDVRGGECVPVEGHGDGCVLRSV